MNDGAESKAIQRKPRAKQLVFYEKWQKHHNATLAAIEAGYSKANAHNTGHRLANNKVLEQRINAYGQLGLDTLAVIATTSRNDIAREKAAEFLVDRAYGKAKSNDADKSNTPNIVISFNKIDSSGKYIQSQGVAIDSTSIGGGSIPATAQGE